MSNQLLGNEAALLIQQQHLSLSQSHILVEVHELLAKTSQRGSAVGEEIQIRPLSHVMQGIAGLASCVDLLAECGQCYFK